MCVCVCVVHIDIAFSDTRGILNGNIRHRRVLRLRVQHQQLGRQLRVGVLRRHLWTGGLPVCISVLLLRRLLNS